jgi:hypothetical protein
MTGPRTLFSFCWPLHPGVCNLLTELFPLVLIELASFLVCTQVIFWVFDGPAPIPRSNPYVPKAKRPPSYLAPFLTWLNATMDTIADELSLHIKVHRHVRHHRTRTQPVTSAGRLPRAFRVLQVIRDHLFKPLFLKWHFLWWRVRCRYPSRATVQILALSALTTDLARANAAVSTTTSHRRAVFDANSFNILIDGGATACISNALSDFIKLPRTSTVQVKGFNGATSSTRVGTVRWSILDDTGKTRTVEVRNTYYVPECPIRLLLPSTTASSLMTTAAPIPSTMVTKWYSFGVVVVLRP